MNMSLEFFSVYGRLPQHLVLALKNLGKGIRDYHASMLQGHSSLLRVPLKKLSTIADNDLTQLCIRGAHTDQLQPPFLLALGDRYEDGCE